ncbi:hypothetical protein [Vibrio albus]|uniref:hypothetical protein n=1 Tax=Vibrio albus TaxID=2200953 RepID=UPI000D69F3BF|nr:hypothetical protein [Vibrio albus]
MDKATWARRTEFTLRITFGIAKRQKPPFLAVVGVTGNGQNLSLIKNNSGIPIGIFMHQGRIKTSALPLYQFI